MVERYMRVEPGARVLDIGCGPGDLVAALPQVDYLGFDPSDAYIASARERFGDRAQFRVGDVRSVEPDDLGRFDLVVAQGVLHHLDDAGAAQLFEIAAGVLADGGRLVTVDPCFAPAQSRLSRAIVSRDRGGNVRTIDAYRALASRSFRDVHIDEHHKLLTIPFSHAVIESSGAIRVDPVRKGQP
ncbi:MAG TPA: class I SAM-dependent methyltransferase [Acidimicrobiia bacterium]|jgi:SAM-dependent methyltransferase|nr:class I SAM-dependent methyltransferase [Acidimicrobiia bacterium]